MISNHVNGKSRMITKVEVSQKKDVGVKLIRSDYFYGKKKQRRRTIVTYNLLLLLLLLFLSVCGQTALMLCG